MNRLRRLAAALAGLAGALLSLAGAAPAALARPAPPRHKYAPLPYGHWTGAGYQPPVRTLVIGGMPGWQIALIAISAALLAATAAVVVYRARAIRRNSVPAAA